MSRSPLNTAAFVLLVGLGIPAHVFGGDQSGRFSNAMTEVLQCTLRHHREIQHAAAKWEKRKTGKPETRMS